MGVLLPCRLPALAGVLWGPQQALFADSVPQGSRSYWYVNITTTVTISEALDTLIDGGSVGITC